MEKELHKIALELKRIRIELEKQNSMVADINSNQEEYFIEDDERPDVSIENLLRGNR